MFLVPIAVVCAIAIVAEELLHPSRLWKVLMTLLLGFLIMTEILEYTHLDNNRYAFSMTVLGVVILFVIQFWRLVPFLFFLVASALALYIVTTFVAAIFAIDISGLDDIIITISVTVSAVATVLLNVKVYRKSVQARLFH
jgi:glucan phosphoethanolaminetransferase (alkaline phosphatase superfamily)